MSWHFSCIYGSLWLPSFLPHLTHYEPTRIHSFLPFLLTDRPTDRPTDRQTDGTVTFHLRVVVPSHSIFKKYSLLILVIPQTIYLSTLDKYSCLITKNITKFNSYKRCIKYSGRQIDIIFFN